MSLMIIASDLFALLKMNESFANNKWNIVGLVLWRVMPGNTFFYFASRRVAERPLVHIMKR